MEWIDLANRGMLLKTVWEAVIHFRVIWMRDSLWKIESFQTFQENSAKHVLLLGAREHSNGNYYHDISLCACLTVQNLPRSVTTRLSKDRYRSPL